MDPVEKLLAIEDIRLLKARYFRFMDTKDWAGLATIFADDATYDATNALRNGNGPDSQHQQLGAEWNNVGGANIAAFVRAAVEPLTTVHHGHMAEIEILSPTTARAVWAMEDVVREVKDGVLIRELRGYGHYWETYVKRDGRWQIQTSLLTRLRVDLDPWPTDA